LGGSLSGRHLTFTPRVAEALALADKYELHAMIDVSDGLSTDVIHVARQSGVGVTIDAASVPVHEDAVGLSGPDAGPEEALAHALNDGEDYELVFCLSAQEAQDAVQSGVLGTSVTVIGSITRARTYNIVMPDGTQRPLGSEGWEHLKR